MNGIAGSLQEEKEEEEQPEDEWLLEVESTRRLELVGIQLGTEERVDEGRPPEEDGELPNGDRLSDNFANKKVGEVGLRDQLLTTNKRAIAAEQLLLQQVFLPDDVALDTSFTSPHSPIPTLLPLPHKLSLSLSIT